MGAGRAGATGIESALTSLAAGFFGIYAPTQTKLIYTPQTKQTTHPPSHPCDAFAVANYINTPDRFQQGMPLNAILNAMDTPVKAEVIKEIIRYMKGVPSDHETLILQCADLLDKDQTLKTVLAVTHALNEGEFLLKCRDDDLLSEHDLSSEFEKLMNSGSESNTATE